MAAVVERLLGGVERQAKRDAAGDATVASWLGALIGRVEREVARGQGIAEGMGRRLMRNLLLATSFLGCLWWVAEPQGSKSWLVIGLQHARQSVGFGLQAREHSNPSLLDTTVLAAGSAPPALPTRAPSSAPPPEFCECPHLDPDYLGPPCSGAGKG